MISLVSLLYSRYSLALSQTLNIKNEIYKYGDRKMVDSILPLGPVSIIKLLFRGKGK